MARIWISLTIVVLMLPALASAGSTATTPRHAKNQAEVNLLRATKVLASWRLGLVDPRTSSLKNNTSAICRGRGQAVRAQHPRFACTLRSGSLVVSVNYSAKRNNGFSIRRLSVSAAWRASPAGSIRMRPGGFEPPTSRSGGERSIP